MFAKMANTITKHSKMVIAVWLVVVICCVPFMMKADSVLNYELTSMTGSDSESAQGNAIMGEYFSYSVNMNEVLVIQYPTGDDTGVDTLFSKIQTLTDAEYSGTVTYKSVGSYDKAGNDYAVHLYSVASSDEDFDFASATGTIRDLVQQAKEEAGISLTTFVTGNAALTYDTMDSANADIAKIDPLSIAIIFILLALFFGAVATAVVPPIGFGAAYAVAMMALYLFGSAFDVFYLTSTLMMVTMLGAGCDYGIFIITRYREELKKGADHHQALVTAIEWAGESVFTSGMSVIIGFACLAICDFSLVRNMGIMLAVGIVFALISALTFTPALVNLIGEKVFWPNKISKYRGIEDGSNTSLYARASKTFGRYFKWVAKVTRKYSKAIVAVAIVVSLPATYIYATSDSSYDMISVEPDGEAKEGLFAIMDEANGGTLMPTYAVIGFTAPATEKIDTVTLGTMAVHYVKWSPYGLTQNPDGSYTGFVPGTMVLSNSIKTQFEEIVRSASGLNSWQVLFYQAVYGQVLAGINANPAFDAYNAEQKAAMTTSQVPTVMTSLNEDQVYTINSGIVSKMVEIGSPSAVTDGITLAITMAHQAAVMLSITSNPGFPVDAVNSVTLANVIDGIMNVETGLVSDDGRYASIMIITDEAPMSDNTMAFVGDLQKAFHGDDGFDSAYGTMIASSYICGTNAVMYDISGTVSTQFDYIQIVVVVLLLILLFIILGCYLTPIRAMICIIASVVWTLALTFVTFQDLMGIPVCWIVPIVLFVVLLGLGMDYDIFITTRVRENRIRGMSNDDAIDAAICSASGTISLCALIMGGTFLTLLVGSSSMLQEFGFALGIGILIDGLVMVTFVGPAIMHLMGEWNWKGPAFLQKMHSKQ